MSQPRTGPRRGPLRRWTPWVVLLAGLLITAAATRYVVRAEREREEIVFESSADDVAHLIDRRLDAYVALLRATGAMLSGETTMATPEFADYVARLHLADRFPGLVGIGFIARLTKDEEPAFVERMRAEGRPSFHLWPPSDAPTRTAIVFLEPLGPRDEGTLGHDVSGDPVRREAMDRAARTGEPAATAKVDLGVAANAGFLLYVPVYHGLGEPPPDRRDELLAGWAYGPFQVRDLLHSALQDAPAMHVAVYDGSAVARDRLLDESGDPVPDHPTFRTTHVLDVAGRRWTVAFTSGAAWQQSWAERLGALTAGGGIVVSLLLFAVTGSLTRAREQAEESAASLRSSEAALRQSERRFRALVEQSPLSIQIMDAGGHTLQVNTAFERLWGTRPGDLDGYSILRDDQLRERGLLPLVEAAFAGRASTTTPFPYVPDTGVFAGETRWVRAVIYPVKDERGAIREVVVVHEDMTERIQVEEALRHAQKLESIGVLAGGIAHDFNNLLTGIMGATTLAMRRVRDPDVRGLLDQVLGASRRAADLTRQLLAYAGKGRFVVRKLDVADIVQEMTELVRASVPKSARIELDLSPEKLTIEADGSQVQQLIMNLVINAGEAIGEQPGTIRVSTRRVGVTADEIARDWAAYDLRPGAHVALVVSDTGHGMDAETKAKIFDPFFTTKFLGRGLGLAAALGIVRGHRGAIKVDSEPGLGTTFLVLLPLASGGVEAVAPPPDLDLRGDGLVLVVDDEDVVRHTARATLEHYGWRVIDAVDGPDALDKIRAHDDVDVVLLDLTMPGMSGVEVSEEMTRLRPGLPIVVSSGYGETETMRRFAGRQLAGFVQKPYEDETLALAVKRAAARPAPSEDEARPPAP